MIIKYAIPLLALAGVGFAVRTVLLAAQEPVSPPPLVEPARAPFEAYVAAAGIIESSSENIAIAALVPGVITEVQVAVGDVLRAGAPLFRIDVRDLEAQLAVERAAVEAAQARIARLEALPRVEDLRGAEAKLVESDAALTEAQQQWSLVEAIQDPRAMSREERTRRRSNVDVARARRDAAQAALDWQRSGAWAPDVAIARAELAQAQARAAAVETQIARATVRAPIAATVLQLNARAGEYAPTGIAARPLVLLGSTEALHVRVDIDENEAWRFQRGAKALAFLRGNRDFSAPLEMVRVEPYVVPKRSLTGESTERVDTRVLQVLYRFDPSAMTSYVGQQVDVFIEAPPVASK
ncbi:MAG: biotin/lipoyl-binding protein [Planctomycetes bacterium]|nr:biotin/lipoyl-binding protein [Planctomycetota bacterium]